MPADISGQVVLITGASSGIGAACAEAFAGAGCKLVLVARRMDKLSALKELCKSKHNVRFHYVTTVDRYKG